MRVEFVVTAARFLVLAGDCFVAFISSSGAHCREVF